MPNTKKRTGTRRKELPVRLNSKPNIRLGFKKSGDMDEAHVKSQQDRMYDNEYVGPMTLLLEEVSELIGRKKLKKQVECPMTTCFYKNDIVYSYQNITWGPVYSHLIQSHTYRPPVVFSNMVDDLVMEHERLLFT